MIDKRENVILIGFMGSGKTTLAKCLSAKLGLGLRELDEEVLAISGYSSIVELFNKKGEAFFRHLEIKALQDVLKKSHQVISCGGGAPVKSGELLAKNGTVIYLKCSLETIRKRLKEDFSRPLLSDLGGIENLYLERSIIYEKLADFTVNSEVKIEIVLESVLNLTNFKK